MRLNFIIGYNGYSFVLVLGHELDTKLCFRFIVLVISNFRIKKSGVGNGFATSELR